MLRSRFRRTITPSRIARGFTLVEILIVVVILGILAAIVVPKLSNASQASRESTLREDLRFLRTQISVYAALHNNVAPGYPGGDNTQSATETDFINQLTQYTDDIGNVSATNTPVFKNGPYLSHMPNNPVNNLTSIKIIAAGGALTPDDSTGWLYQAATGAIQANVSGNDSGGQAFGGY